MNDSLVFGRVCANYRSNRVNMEILCFFAGTAFFYYKHISWLGALAIVLFFNRKYRYIIYFFAGLIGCMLHQYMLSSSNPSVLTTGKTVDLEGFISSIPVLSAHKTQFQFRAIKANHQSIDVKLLVSCYQHCPTLHAGEYWQLKAKLRKPYNLANPGGFDYVAWLSARHIELTGYSVNHSFKQLTIKPSWRYYWLLKRQQLGLLLEAINSNDNALGISEALTLGLTNAIDSSQWDLFRRTGTTHLMVISGSHIALVAGFVFTCIKYVWASLPWLALRVPAQRAAAIVSLALASVYALMAGFEVPSQRSLVACFILLSRFFFSQRFSVWQSWRYALGLVIVFEPHCVTMPGFYLSFIAVAILVLVSERTQLTGFKQAIILQLACLFGMMPLSLLWFSYGSLNGFFANIIAIPWVGFVVVPLALINIILVSSHPVLWLNALVNQVINWLLMYLKWMDSFSTINLTYSPPNWLIPCLLMTALVIIIFIPLWRLIFPVLVFSIASFFSAANQIKASEFVVNVMDVAEGLAIVVRTKQHYLLYDTGVKFNQGSDMGRMVIIPYLTTLGTKRLDKVVISHPDLDHRGGLSSIQNAYPIDELIVDDPSFYKTGVSCHDYPDWDWDGVHFHFFSIKGADLQSKNNTSCVLQVSNSAGKIILTGDIEKPAETYLVKHYGNTLMSSVMVVPHHGSKTSSSVDFIQQVSPRYAILSYGFENRYHFPHIQTLQTYERQGTRLFNTVDCGMVSVEFNAAGIKRPSCYR